MDLCGASSIDADVPDVEGDSKLELGAALFTVLKALTLGSAIFKRDPDINSGSGLMSGKRKLDLPIGEKPNRSSSDGNSSNDVDSSDGNGMNCSEGFTLAKAIS